jgi:pyridinium-3,5-biscarboxylic acid mononucleotide sulfurtransferase
MVAPARLELALPLAPEAVRARIRSGGAALVALSGGVDSAVVAALAFEALGADAHAVTIVGPSVSREELLCAERAGREIGIDHRLIEADPLSNGSYRANGPDRCYFCRSVEGGALARWAEEQGLAQRLDGLHRDDLSEDRPGRRAMDEAGFRHPLLEAGWHKPDVRRFAAERGLSSADRPSNACLASRIATGEPVTAELLVLIERAEAAVRERGFRRVRVRSSRGSARVEVDPSELARLLEPTVAADLHLKLASLGFTSVELDRRGYRGRGAKGPDAP